MTSRLVVLTGASRGLGAAMADRLLQPGTTLLGIARRVNATLAETARERGATLEQWPRDLAEPVPVAEALEAWLGAHDATALREAWLINNAGVVGRIGPVDEAAYGETATALRVGLEATVLMTAAFVRATRGWRADRRVMNISSGLGRRPMAGSAVYCAAKAGMDLFSRSVALDEQHRGSGLRIESIAPGVIDTDMQADLRGAPAAGFPDQRNFVGLKSGGQLATPATTAARLLDHLASERFGAEVLTDVRQL